MHARHLVSRLVISAFAIIIVTGCGRDPVVGVLLPMSGDAGSYGDSMNKAIDRALAVA